LLVVTAWTAVCAASTPANNGSGDGEKDDEERKQSDKEVVKEKEE
jgi:hypothetical protein